MRFLTNFPDLCTSRAMPRHAHLVLILKTFLFLRPHSCSMPPTFNLPGGKSNWTSTSGAKKTHEFWKKSERRSSPDRKDIKHTDVFSTKISSKKCNICGLIDHEDLTCPLKVTDKPVVRHRRRSRSNRR
jgi:hypothetical protein